MKIKISQFSGGLEFTIQALEYTAVSSITISEMKDQCEVLLVTSLQWTVQQDFLK